VLPTWPTAFPPFVNIVEPSIARGKPAAAFGMGFKPDEWLK